MPGAFRLDLCDTCCAPAGCDYFTDDFNRADSSNLGSDWTEQAGDWSISSNQLTVSTASATVKCNTTHPSSSTKYRVSVLMQGGQEGDALRAWINNDSTTFGEITFHTAGATGRARLRLFVAGTLKGETDIDAPPGSQHYLYLCTDGTHLALGVAGTLYLSAPITITSSICGLATGALNGATAAKFDNFKLTKHTDDDSACPACGESCTWFADGFDGDPINQTPALSPDSYATVVGSWVWNGTLVEIEDADARLIETVISPSGSAHMVYAQFTMTVWSPGPILLADYQNEDNFLYLETDYYGHAYFYRRASGVNTLLAELVTWFVATDAMIIVGNSEAAAWVGYGGSVIQCVGRVSHIPTVSKAGIGTSHIGYFGQTLRWHVLRLTKHPDTVPACFAPSCPGGLTCSHCSATPTAIDVLLASVASEAACDFSDPGGCLLWNDTFQCDQDGTDPCKYVYTAGGTPGSCSPHHIVVLIHEIGSFVHEIVVTAYADAGETRWIRFRRSYTTAPIACSSLAGESIPFDAQNVCAGTPTCLLTANL